MSEQQTEEEQAFRAVTVGRRGLELIRPLIEAFVETVPSEWDVEGFLRMVWEGLGTPFFRLWTVLEEGQTEPLGFVAARLQPGREGMEVYILAAYGTPGVPLGASEPVVEACRRWARVMGAQRMMARTVRGDENGLAEPHAWERFGFRFDSVLLVADVNGEARVAPLNGMLPEGEENGTIS